MTETPVIFRIPKDGSGVFALFPTLPSDVYGLFCTSYQHVGQHGGADYTGCVATSRPARPDEYADLLAELVQIGYDDLAIRRRFAFRPIAPATGSRV